MAIAFVGLALAATVVWAYLTDPVRAARLVSGRMSEQLGAEVRIASVRVGLRGVTTLHEIEVRVPGVEGPLGRLFSARSVEVEHGVWGLVRGRLRVNRVTVIDPVVYVTRDVATERYNFGLLPAREDRGPPQRAWILSEVFVPKAQVRFGEVEHEAYEPVGSLWLSGQLVAAGEGREHFLVRVVQHPDGDLEREGVTVRGQVAAEIGRAEARIGGFRLGPQQRVALPGKARALWDQLGPEGVVSGARVVYDAAGGFELNCALYGGRVASPYPTIARYVDRIQGRVKVSEEGVEVTGLTGRWGDVTCEGWGRFSGWGAGQRFEAGVRVRPFEVPWRPGYLADLPEPVQRYFGWYDPCGMVEGQAVVRRREAGGTVEYQGWARVSQGRARFHKFPYPVREVEGLVEVDRESVRITEIRGKTPNGADVKATGWVLPAQGGPEVDLTIACTGAKVDRTLHDALTVHERATVDLFLDQGAIDRLEGEGAVQSSDRKRGVARRLARLREQHEKLAAKPGAVPEALERLGRQIQEAQRLAAVTVFDPGGAPAVNVNIHRDPGPDQPTVTKIRVDLAGVGVLYRHWPYPLRLTGGRLEIEPGLARVEGLEAVGMSGGRVRAEGRVELHKRHGRVDIEPRVDLAAEGVPVDGWLLGSVPEKQRRWLEGLKLTGSLSATGEAFRGGGGEPGYRVRASVSGGTARPFGDARPIEALEGSVTLEPGRAVLDQLRGEVAGGRIGLSGRVDWMGDQDMIELGVTFNDMPVDPALWRGLSGAGDGSGAGEAERFIEANEITGLWDGKLSYAWSSQGARDFSIEIRPKRIELRCEQQPVALEAFTGRALITPRQVTLDGLGASFAGGGFEIDGVAELSAGSRVDLTVKAKGQRICPATRAALPAPVCAVIDGMSLDGAYRIESARITHRPQDGSATGWDVEGRVWLEGARAAVGVPITEISGPLDFKMSRPQGAAWPTLGLKLQARRLRAGGRLIEPMVFQLESGEDPQHLDVRAFEGRCYGGSLLGSGEIVLGRQGRYRLNLTLQDVNLDGFLHPGQEPGTDVAEEATAGGLVPAEKESSDEAAGQPGLPEETPPKAGDDGSSASTSGILSASLWIEGSLEQTKNRHGRGELEIRNGRLYEVPVALATIQVLNLSLPASRSFDRATVKYLLEDDLVRLEQIRFEAPTLVLAGAGKLTYSTQELELDLFTRNPTSPDLGPVSDLVDVFKDELVRIRVTGTLGDPKPKVASLEGIKESWREVFGEEKEKTSPAPEHNP